MDALEFAEKSGVRHAAFRGDLIHRKIVFRPAQKFHRQQHAPVGGSVSGKAVAAQDHVVDQVSGQLIPFAAAFGGQVDGLDQVAQHDTVFPARRLNPEDARIDFGPEQRQPQGEQHPVGVPASEPLENARFRRCQQIDRTGQQHG